MTNYGPNKEEKWGLSWSLFCVSFGSFLTAISVIASVPWIILFLIPGLGILILGAIQVFNWTERLSLRIRIEESREKSELIDKIVAIYRGNG